MRCMTGGTAALVAVAGLAAPAAAQSDFQFRRELPVNARFALRNVIGDVRIEAASGRALEVTAVKREGRHGDPDDVEIRAVDLGGDGVAICVEYPGSGRWRNDTRRDRDRDQGRRRGGDDPCRRDGGGWSNDRNDTRVDFTVRLPADLSVDIKTVSGDVTGDGLRGALVVGTVSGSLRLTGVRGPSLEATSVSGDVDLAEADIGDVEAETVSGDVTYAGTIRRDGKYYFKTLSGDVELVVPGTPDATLRGSTFSGRVVSDFPTTSGDRRRRSRFNATWGSGSATIDVESFSGTVRIRQASR